MTLEVNTGISEESQQANFMNATLQSIGGNAVSISIQAPEALVEQGMTEEALKAELLRVFNNLACDGWEIEIQIGPES